MNEKHDRNSLTLHFRDACGNFGVPENGCYRPFDRLSASNSIQCL